MSFFRGSYYSDWTESELRNGIYFLSIGMSIRGPYSDPELLREELRRRGLEDDGYHNT